MLFLSKVLSYLHIILSRISFISNDTTLYFTGLSLLEIWFLWHTDLDMLSIGYWEKGSSRELQVKITTYNNYRTLLQFQENIFPIIN